MLGIYLALLLCSTLARRAQTPEKPPGGIKREMVRAVKGESLLDEPALVAYRTAGEENAGRSAPVILLHGSPGDSGVFERLTPLLSNRFHLIIPDLPGFGASRAEIPDYSIRAHAHYLRQLMDRLKIERAHLIGYSMGGGVALDLADLAPERVASITMLSSIGVQEMELLGDYHVNHLIHGVQLAGIWSIHNLFPHFGLFDEAIFDVAYARNFYDTDQRPLRAILGRIEAPMLIIHGKNDFLVPIEAAVEHHRLVPQSEISATDGDHFMLFTTPETFAPAIANFIARADAGEAPGRKAASAERIAASQAPFDPARLPKAIGMTAVVVFLLLATSTLVSEDLTCITAGLMAAQGRISFALGASACTFGIYVGDLLLFIAGRYLGRPAIRSAPLKWMIKPGDVERSSAWFSQRGAVVIFLSRFVPGLRLPTYFAAGVLKTSLLRFALYFFLACLVWTPILVGASMILGGELVSSALVDTQSLLLRIVLAGLLLLVLVRVLLRMTTWRGRRLLLSRLKRIRHWEFWPAWIFYLPVIAYLGYLSLRYRSLTLFTLANPSIPGGGFIGESKAQILEGLEGAGEFIARAQLIRSALEPEERLGIARRFMNENRLVFPVVVKPDAGQRGSGVVIVRDEAQLERCLDRVQTDMLIQEYAGGDEFGVFYYRHPEEERGHILAITEKRFPVVEGDGKKTLEELILGDERAVCMASFLLETHRHRLLERPAKGERVELVELGTHCRGAIFLDGGWIRTEAFEERIDEIARSFDGFYFGRFDLRAPSVEELKRGNGFRVIELNGVTSEATSIYDPRNPLTSAYRLLFRQWRIAFEIGAWHRARGLKPTSIRELLRWTLDYRRSSRAHFNSSDLVDSRQVAALEDA